MEYFERSKKLEQVRGGGIQEGVHKEGYDTHGERKRCRTPKAALGKEEASRGSTGFIKVDNTEGQDRQAKDATLIPNKHVDCRGFKCMYTNLDSFCNKRSELETRIHIYKPDIIGLTEINPKNMNNTCTTNQDFYLTGYNMFVNLTGRGSALYVRECYSSAEVNLQNSIDAATWCTRVNVGNLDTFCICVFYVVITEPL